MTTPAQPESKTPISEEIRVLAGKISASCDFNGDEDRGPCFDIGLCAKLVADFVAGREAALNETNNLLAIYFGACRENYQAQSIQAEADRREIESANSIKSAEKKILIKEIENHVVTKQALATAQQRIKELEHHKDIVLMLVTWSNKWPRAGVYSETREKECHDEFKSLEDSAIATMSREQKEGKAK